LSISCKTFEQSLTCKLTNVQNDVALRKIICTASREEAPSSEKCFYFKNKREIV